VFCHSFACVLDTFNQTTQTNKPKQTTKIRNQKKNKKTKRIIGYNPFVDEHFERGLGIITALPAPDFSKYKKTVEITYPSG
jgi:hypothetical protein